MSEKKCQGKEQFANSASRTKHKKRKRKQKEKEKRVYEPKQSRKEYKYASSSKESTWNICDVDKKKNTYKTREASESDECDWVEKHFVSTTRSITMPPETTETNDRNTIQREIWMTDAVALKTYSRERKQEASSNNLIEIYDPVKSTRELNPYWKTTGTGLPSFKKPKDDSTHDIPLKSSIENAQAGKNWKKKNSDANRLQRKNLQEVQKYQVDYSGEQRNKERNHTVSLSDKQMNELGAKILKAEIMGNLKLADELKIQLDRARNEKCSNDKDYLHTDRRTITKSRPPLNNPYFGAKVEKPPKQQKVETDVHSEREQYFRNDDKYDIKRMFEHEKCTGSRESVLQFADIAGKHKNRNDDLDIFTNDNIKNINTEQADKKDVQRATREHKKITSTLDNCSSCMESGKMNKKSIIAIGENVYLALPWYTGLQTGHCLIVPTQHIGCCTQLDENVWDEVNNFRRSLTKMFAAQRKEVIFFEIANKLHRRPHLNIHCVPIDIKHGELAPFYFKKAIEESEYEWSINRQLVLLNKKGLRNSIPKSLPYVWVSFGMDNGFAHVIEDEDRFPSNFVQEIIGGMLRLETNSWRKLQKNQNIRENVKMLSEWWKNMTNK